MNLPTKITISRIFLIPVFLVFFYVPFWGHYFFAALVFTISACTDFVDGYIARHRNMVTNFGKFLDPIADKALAAVAMVVMVDVNQLLAPYGAVAVSLIICRELIVSAFRIVAASKGIMLAADTLGKLKTIFTNIALPVIMLAFAFTAKQLGNLYKIYHYFFYYAGHVAFAIAFVLTIVSGAHYIAANKKVFEEKGDAD